jgi:hypothetical protein
MFWKGDVSSDLHSKVQSAGRSFWRERVPRNLPNTCAATARPLSVKTTAVFTRHPRERLIVTSRSPAAFFSARSPIDRMYLDAAKRVMFNSLAYHPTGRPSLSTTDRKTTANGRGIGRSRKSLIGFSADKRVCTAFLSLGDICSGCCQSSWRSALEVVLSAPIRHDPTAGVPARVILSIVAAKAH